MPHPVYALEQAKRPLIVIQADRIGPLGIADRPKCDHPPVRPLHDPSQARFGKDPEIRRVLVQLRFPSRYAIGIFETSVVRSGSKRVIRVLSRQYRARLEIVSRT